MNALESAAWEIHNFLGDLGVRYAIIGGFAVQHWGEPRFTQDIDLTVQSPIDALSDFVGEILQAFRPRLDDALDFALENRVILVQASNGYPLDISLGLPGYEDEVFERAVAFTLGPGQAIWICAAEDLIIHKAVAGRAQDIRDIEGIVYRQGTALDADYIRHWLREFAEILETTELMDFFERPWRKVTGKP